MGKNPQKTAILERIQPGASIVVLTGAGISVESGLETFRGAGGLWCGHRVEDVATPEAFVRNPALVHEFYNLRRRGLLEPQIKPNAAHTALAELEEKWDGDVLVVTQNIDDLHERAGTKNLIHMHGEVLKAFCHFCMEKAECRDDLSIELMCAACGTPGGMRPDIVWFGEMPYEMERIEQALLDADVFIAIGTSGHVYPAAGFVALAKHAGALTLEMNLDPSQNSSVFNESVIGAAGIVVPEFVSGILQL